MSVFDLEPQDQANLYERAATSPQAEPNPPGFFANAQYAPFKGVGAIFTDLALLQDTLTPDNIELDPLTGGYISSTPERRKAIADQYVKASKASMPDPATTGTAGSVLFGLFNVVPEAMFLTPEVAAVLQGNRGFRQAQAEGVDTGTAAAVGTIDALSTELGFRLPAAALAKYGWKVNVAGQAAGFAGLGAASRAGTSAVLRANGYDQMADQYKALDATAILTDAVLGAAFAGLHSATYKKPVEPGAQTRETGDTSQANVSLNRVNGFATSQQVLDMANQKLAALQRLRDGTQEQSITGPDGQTIVIPGEPKQLLTPEQKSELAFLEQSGTDAEAVAQAYGLGIHDEVSPSTIDAALVAENANHVEIGVAPGIPADPASRQAHVNQVEETINALLRGDEPPPADGPAEATFVENPAANAARAEIAGAVREHLAPLLDELASRGLPADETLYSIEPTGAAPVRFTERVRNMLKEHTQTGDTSELLRKLSELQGDLQERVARHDAKAADEPVRGELWVRERLQRAERLGEISPEQHALAKWLLDKNPNLANDLAISLRSARDAAAGQYSPALRLFTLFKNRGNDMTAAHEILHHAERMMPDNVRRGVAREWMDWIQSMHDLAKENGDTKMSDAVDDVLKAAAGDYAAARRLRDQVALGDLPHEFYQYTNPSEYWAVNAARIVRDRANAGGWVGEAVQWLKELLEHAKAAFGLHSNSAVIKALNAVLKGDGTLTGDMLSSGEYFDIRRPGDKSPDARVAGMLRRTAENENRTAVVVGGRPGEFGWTLSDKEAVPAPIQHPVQRGPRLEKIGPAVKGILDSSGFRKLAQEIAGLTRLKVEPIEGTWKGNPEPSFVVRGENLSEEGAGKLARLLGFAFAQDATVVTKHAPDLVEGIPTVYAGGREVLRPEQLQQIIEAAREHGLDLSTSADKKAVKFMYFGDEAGLDKFHADVAAIADRVGFDALSVMTQGDLYEAGSYLERQDSGVRGEGGDQASPFGSPDLFRRVVDHALVPYAKAVAAEGYRLSPDRLAERFGLSDAERELIRDKLRPKEGESRSTVPLMTGEEKLDVVPTSVKGKTKSVSVNDIMWALQNRAAQTGLIEPGDYSDKSLKVIAQAIAKEVSYHVTHAVKSAIGWYDAALKKAKVEYSQIFPEVLTNPDNGMLFDALLGITSQGNDVHSNSIFGARIYQLVRDGGMTLSEGVDFLKGTFGNQTRAVEINLLKLEHLLNANGYQRMREVFNKTMTVSEWNALLRKDSTLYGPDGSPLAVEGAASQKVTGWMVFGPKIGSFINNLHGDYTTLTADLWFSRTWNRLLGFMFQHSPLKEAKQYQEFKDALQAEYQQLTTAKTQNGREVMKGGKPVPWENGKDVVGMHRADFDQLINDPDNMLALARALYDTYSKGGFKDKSDLRRRAKNWVESRDEPVAAPRSDLERDFQQRTVEAAQKLLRKDGVDISVADIQAALWFHEKDLFGKLGASDKRSAPADYADAAKATVQSYRDGKLFLVESKQEYIGGENGKYLGLTVPTEGGAEMPALKAIDHADAEIATAQQESQGYDAAVACALRG